MPARLQVLLAFSLVALMSCRGSDVTPKTIPAGPPSVQADVVARHAEQFDEDLEVREPGSQEELAAASYILGHLQQAGYAPLLDAVPVKNLVKSTNVVAAPPNGEDPSAVVAVPYDSGGILEGRGAVVGTFLELARALNRSDPDHRVGFVAMGAQSFKARGAVRLVSFLRDRDAKPLIVTLEGPGPSLRFEAFGDRAGEVMRLAGSGAAEDPTEVRWIPLDHDEVFEDAGLENLSVLGDPEVVGEVLLEWLQRF